MNKELSNFSPGFDFGNSTQNLLYSIYKENRKGDDNTLNTLKKIAKNIQAPKEKIDLSNFTGIDSDIGSLPKSFFQIQEIINSPGSTAKQLGDIISKDMALTAKILRLANSPLFGFQSQIDNIGRAVTLLGVRQVGLLAISMRVISKFNNIPQNVIDMRAFWKHSVACALGCRILGDFKNVPNIGSLFISGLLHDIGRLIMLIKAPKATLHTMYRAQEENQELTIIEQEVFTHNHAVLGSLLLKEWDLPLNIRQAVADHEHPSKHSITQEKTITHMANVLAICCNLGTSGEFNIPKVDMKAWRKMEISDDVLKISAQAMKKMVTEIHNRIFTQ